MTGIRKISKEITAKCPHCYHQLDLRELGHELFRRILLHLVNGEDVTISKFGRFVVRKHAGRKAYGLTSGATSWPDYKRIYFKSMPAVKVALNKDRKKKEKKDEQDGDDSDS